MGGRVEVGGRLVLDDAVVPGRVVVHDGIIASVDLDEDGAGGPDGGRRAGIPEAGGPIVAPGFVDVHVHGWGGHDAMGDTAALDGMARALARRGVTSFLPTAVALPVSTLATFAERVRGWIPVAPADGGMPLGFNLEGPFLAEVRKGAHEAIHLRTPADVDASDFAPMLDGLRLITIAPELPGALALIAELKGWGVAVSMGHSAATFDEARAGYDAGGSSTTHLFNAMSGVDHRAPGLAVAALTDDNAYVELIADGQHVHRALWPLIVRAKPADRLLLVSDAIPQAGVGAGRGWIGALEIEIVGDRVTLAGTTTLAGSVIALDTAVRNLVAAGVSLPATVAAASRNPLALIGVTDRGRIAVGQRADLVELGAGLDVRRVMIGGHWLAG
jgi:N-acetylglucosamine-6-phosphate deacetylase